MAQVMVEIVNMFDRNRNYSHTDKQAYSLTGFFYIGQTRNLTKAETIEKFYWLCLEIG